MDEKEIMQMFDAFADSNDVEFYRGLSDGLFIAEMIFQRLVFALIIDHIIETDEKTLDAVHAFKASVTSQIKRCEILAKQTANDLLSKYSACRESELQTIGGTNDYIGNNDIPF